MDSQQECAVLELMADDIYPVEPAIDAFSTTPNSPTLVLPTTKTFLQYFADDNQVIETIGNKTTIRTTKRNEYKVEFIQDLLYMTSSLDLIVINPFGSQNTIHIDFDVNEQPIFIRIDDFGYDLRLNPLLKYEVGALIFANNQLPATIINYFSALYTDVEIFASCSAHPILILNLIKELGTYNYSTIAYDFESEELELSLQHEETLAFITYNIYDLNMVGILIWTSNGDIEVNADLSTGIVETGELIKEKSIVFADRVRELLRMQGSQIRKTSMKQPGKKAWHKGNEDQVKKNGIVADF